MPAARAASTARSSAAVRGARVAPRALREVVERVGGDRRRVRDPPLAVGERPRQQPADVLDRQRPELVDLRAAEQRRVDLEEGVLGRRPDQGHEALLDGREQGVLLGLVEAVDLVEEEDRRLAGGAAALGRALDHRPHLGPAGVHRRLLLEGAARRGGDDPRERRLARPGRPVEDHRVRLAGLDRGSQGRPLGEQVLLADELVERGRAHAHRQRRLGGRHRRAPGGRLRVVGLEQTVHPGEYESRRRRRPRVSRGGARPRASSPSRRG